MWRTCVDVKFVFKRMKMLGVYHWSLISWWRHESKKRMKLWSLVFVYLICNEITLTLTKSVSCPFIFLGFDWTSSISSKRHTSWSGDSFYVLLFVQHAHGAYLHIVWIRKFTCKTILIRTYIQSWTCIDCNSLSEHQQIRLQKI